MVVVTRRGTRRLLDIVRLAGTGLVLLGLIDGRLLAAGAEASSEGKVAVQVLSRTMVDAGKVKGLRLIIGDRSGDMLRIKLFYERHDDYHLGEASLRFRDKEKAGLALPVRIVTDKEGQDRLQFSVSNDNAAQAFLRLELWGRESEQDPKRVRHVYVLNLESWLEA